MTGRLVWLGLLVCFAWAAFLMVTGKAAAEVPAVALDGDTLIVPGPRYVRILGIDTPERGRCGYERATRELTRLLGAGRVELMRDAENRDRYGRLLRYVRKGHVDIGLQMLERGYADLSMFPHRREYRYVQAWRRAEMYQRGLWRTCSW